MILFTIFADRIIHGRPPWKQPPSQHPHTMPAIRHFLLACTSLVLAFFPVHTSAQEAQGVNTTRISARIDPSKRLQTHEGWGVSLCWWANMCGRWKNEGRLDTLLTLLASPGHLNYNVFRYNIGGGDDPQWRNCKPHHFGGRNGKGLRAEMPGFKDSLNGPYVWNRDLPQRRVMLKLRRLRPDALFEAFSNSAPYYLTASGCVGGAEKATDDNVPEKNYEHFARYLVDVCTMYRDSFQLEFHSLEPFNEPVTDYWYRNGSQEGCHFSASSQIRFLHVLAPILKASGLRTLISASDETSIAQSVTDFQAYKDDGEALRTVGQWNVHSYKGDNDDRAKLRELARLHGKRLWMSESGDGGEGIHGNLKMAQRLIDDMRILQPTVWTDWQYVEEYGDQWSLITSDWNHERYHLNKNYWVRYQFTHFIKPGYTYLDTPHPYLLAALSPDRRELVIVSLNSSKAAARQDHLVLSDFHVDDSSWKIKAYRTSQTEDAKATADFKLRKHTLRYQLPPLSVCTFVLRR